MLWIITAAASAPDVRVNDDHSITGHVVVASPVSTLRAKLADPRWLAQISSGGTTVEVIGRDERCVEHRNVSPNAVKTVRYTVRQCPTERGYRSTLIQSDTFQSYETTWTLDPVPEGTAVTYRLATTTALMVPQFLIDRGSRKGVEEMLGALQDHFREPRSDVHPR